MGRIGCSYCFQTLNPNDPDPDRRRFVRCTGVRCGAFYHDHKDCWRGSCISGNCVCRAASKVVVSLQPPPAEIRSVVPLFCGPVNTLNDLPLGLSAGLVGDLAPDPIKVTNNSECKVLIPNAFGPPWATLVWELPSDFEGSGAYVASRCQRLLEPGESLLLGVHLHRVRPRMAEWLISWGDQYVVVQSLPRIHGWFVLGMVIFWILFILHLFIMSLSWGTTQSMSALGWASISFGVLTGYLALISPGWSRFTGLWFVDRVEAITGTKLKGLYSFVEVPDIGRSVVWAAFWCAATTIVHAGIIGLLRVRIVHAAADTWYCITFGNVVYCSLLLVVVNSWLVGYNICLRRFVVGLLSQAQRLWSSFIRRLSNRNGSANVTRCS